MNLRGLLYYFEIYLICLDPELGKFKAGSGSGRNHSGSTTLIKTIGTSVTARNFYFWKVYVNKLYSSNDAQLGPILEFSVWLKERWKVAGLDWDRQSSAVFSFFLDL